MFNSLEGEFHKYMLMNQWKPVDFSIAVAGWRRIDKKNVERETRTVTWLYSTDMIA